MYLQSITNQCGEKTMKMKKYIIRIMTLVAIVSFVIPTVSSVGVERLPNEREEQEFEDITIDRLNCYALDNLRINIQFKRHDLMNEIINLELELLNDPWNFKLWIINNYKLNQLREELGQWNALLREVEAKMDERGCL